MTTSSIKNYLKYVQDVLGVKKVFYTSSNHLSTANIPQPQSLKLTVTVENLETYSRSENQLLQKMMTAMELSEQDFEIVSLDAITDAKGVFILNFVDEPKSTQQTNQFFAYSPRRLEKNPGLKKESWVVMQSLLQKIKA